MKTLALSSASRVSQQLLLVVAMCLFLSAWMVRTSDEPNGDGRLALAYALVDEGRLAIDTYVHAEPHLEQDTATRDGHYYTAKPPLPSLILAVPYAGLRLVAGPASIGSTEWRWLMTVLLSGTALAALCLILWRMQGELGLRSGRSVVPALVAVTATPLVIYATTAMTHVLSAALVLVVHYLAVLRPRRAFLAGALFGALVATEPVAAVSAAPAFLWLVARRVREAGPVGVLSPLAGATLLAAPLPVYLTLALGSPTADLYAQVHERAAALHGLPRDGPVFGPPQPEALAGLLVSGDRGLLVFAPIAVVGLWRLWSLRRAARAVRTAGILSASGAAALLLVISGYAFWDGGAAWGPRYLVPAVPLLCWSLASLPLGVLAVVGIAASIPHLVAYSLMAERALTVVSAVPGLGSLGPLVPLIVATAVYARAPRRAS